MTLNSSPPLLPDDPGELPSTVTLSAVDTQLPEPYLKRRPSHFDSEPNIPSSDPVFSDSPSEADVEDYLSHERLKRKRHIRGPWWFAGKKQKHRKLQDGSSLRKSLAKGMGVSGPVDSGVWMGSDASEESVDSILSSQQRMRGLRVREESIEEEREGEQAAEEGEEWNGFSDDDDTMIVEPTSSQATVSGDDAALDIVHGCVDAGREVVDLTDLALTELHNNTLRPLQQLIRHPHISLTEPPSEDEFTALTPSIQLYLSGNWLRSLPTELARLENLTVLSLRNNSLEEIPAGIGKLRKLKELNIAQNKISVLPWEMLDLVGRRTAEKRIILRPNPFLQPRYFTHKLSDRLLADLVSRLTPRLKRIHVNDSPKLTPADSEQDFRTLQELARVHSVDPRWLDLALSFKEAGQMKWQQMELKPYAREDYLTAHSQHPTSSLNVTLYLASSPIAYFDPDGSRHRPSFTSPPSPPTSLDPVLSSTTPQRPAAPTPSHTSAGLSLFALALRSAEKFPSDLSTEPGLPPRVVSALRKVHENNTTSGNERCSTCCREFVIPRAEWIEYWAVNASPKGPLKADDIIPFRRRVCGWVCARESRLGDHRY